MKLAHELDGRLLAPWQVKIAPRWWVCPLCGERYNSRTAAKWCCQSPAADDPGYDRLIADAEASDGHV